MATETVVCPHCDAKLKSSTASAGKKIRCPKCDKAFAVPALDKEVLVPARKANAAPPAKRLDDQIEAAEPRPTPARKRARPRDDDDEDGENTRSNPLLLWGLIGGGAGIVVLAGVVIGIFLIVNKDKGSSSSLAENQSSQFSASSSSLSSPSASMPVVQATDLTRELEATGDRKFTDKYVRGQTLMIVEGAIFLTASSDDAYVLALAGHLSDPTSGTGVPEMKHTVRCAFAGKEMADVRTLKFGQTVQVRGTIRYAAKADGVDLVNCQLVSVTKKASSAGSGANSSSASSSTSFISSSITQAASEEMKRFQGKWTLVRAELAGALQPSSGAVIYTFEEDRMMRNPQKDDPTIRYRIDPGTTPKQFDLIVQLGDIVSTCPGIYKLDGDTLTICYDGALKNRTRPTEFTTKAGTYLAMLVLKRQSSAVDTSSDEAEKRARALLALPSPLPPGWRFGDAKAGAKLWTDRKYAIGKLSPELDGGVLLITNVDQN